MARTAPMSLSGPRPSFKLVPVDDLDTGADPLTPAEHAELQGLRSDALAGRRIAISTGIAAGATAALGGTLLALARRSSPKKRWSAAPWGSPTSAGLILRVQLDATR